MKLLVKGAIATAIALSLGTTNAACNVDRWDVKSATAKSVTAGASRYEGLCALDGSTGMVEKNINGGGDTYFRFYVFAENNGSNLTIFRATGGATADVKLNGGNVELGTAKVALAKGKWNNVEVHLKGTSAKIKVNGKNEKSATIAGLGNITKVALGKVAGNVSGKLFFDAFVASNGAAVGKASVSLDEAGKAKMLVAGDASGDGRVTPLDAIQVMREFKAISSSNAVPDCNADGRITPVDAICIIRKFKGL